MLFFLAEIDGKRKSKQMQAYHKWAGLRLEIVEYCKENQISENEFRFLGIYEWENVYDEVLKHFVDERYARKHGLHWSNIEDGFQKNNHIIYAFQEGNNVSCEWIEKLPEIVQCEKIYLLMEEKRQRAKYWIAESTPAVVYRIINEALYPIDYYITDKKFKWLITKNHHDLVQFIGEGLDLEIVKAICTE